MWENPAWSGNHDNYDDFSTKVNNGYSVHGCKYLGNDECNLKRVQNIPESTTDFIFNAWTRSLSNPRVCICTCLFDWS